MQEKIIGTPCGQCRVLVCDHLPSTNLTAREMAADGAPDGTVIIAREQSAGRGRLGRSFYSPDGTGLYMSVILRRDLSASDALCLTPMAAVATAQAIEETIHRCADIKWVNDIYLDGKKVCGILTEGVVAPGSSRLDYAVIGIGVNITPPTGGFPEELKTIAGAILNGTEDADAIRLDLAERILYRLMLYLKLDDKQTIHEEYCKRSVVIGRQVTVHCGNVLPYEAQAIGIAPDYHLIVRTTDGRDVALDSGEISVRL